MLSVLKNLNRKRRRFVKLYDKESPSNLVREQKELPVLVAMEIMKRSQLMRVEYRLRQSRINTRKEALTIRIFIPAMRTVLMAPTLMRVPRRRTKLKLLKLSKIRTMKRATMLEVSDRDQKMRAEVLARKALEVEQAVPRKMMIKKLLSFIIL